MAEKRFLTSVAIFLTLLPGSTFGQTGGRDLYIAKCSACHAPDGSGNNTIGRSLKLGDMRPAIKSMTDDQLREIILQGRGKMLPTRKFDDEKVRNLTLFLHDLAAGIPDTGRALAQAQAQPLPTLCRSAQRLVSRLGSGGGLSMANRRSLAKLNGGALASRSSAVARLVALRRRLHGHADFGARR